MQIIYFDNNATTKIAPQVLVKMNETYQMPLNNSAVHYFGRLATKFIEDARKEVRKLLNAQNYEVIFGSSATEATNTLFQGCNAKKILISQIEHASAYSCRPHEKEVSEIKVLDNGVVDLEDLKLHLEKISDPNFLVSVMFANNETGALQPVEEISKLVHQKGGLFHCDIVQGVGKVPLDLEKINADFASISAHKINGPQGVGALLMRKGLDVKPLIVGGKQEKSKRAGTMNTAGIAGFGEACKITTAKISEYENVKKLRALLESEIKKISGDNVKIFCEETPRLPNTCFVALKNCDAQTQLINFDINGICVSAGSACSSGTVAGSRILKSMGVDSAFSTSAIRISLAPENTKEEVDKFIKVWSEFYERTKK